MRDADTKTDVYRRIALEQAQRKEAEAARPRKTDIVLYWLASGCDCYRDAKPWFSGEDDLCLRDTKRSSTRRLSAVAIRRNKGSE